MTLEFLKKRWFLVALVILGTVGYFVRGWAAHLPRNWTFYTLFLTMCFVGMTADLKALGHSLLNWKASLLSLSMTFLAAPLAAYLVALTLFHKGDALFSGCVLVGCAASTISSAIVYTRLAGGNNSLSIILSNLSNIISTVLTPAMIGVLLGATVKFKASVGDMIYKMILGVLLPIILAQAIGLLFPRATTKFRPTASVLSQVGILVVVFGTVCETFSKADSSFYAELPKVGLKLVLASLAIYFVLIRVSYALARRSGLTPPDSVAVSYASAQKTLAATVYLARDFFTPMASLPIIIYHFVQLLYGGYDGERLKQLAEQDGRADHPLSARVK